MSINVTVPRKLKPLLKPKRYKIIIGGRGSGKSQTVADLCLIDAMSKSLKIGCFREFQNSIEDSVYSLLESEIERLTLPNFDLIKTKIEHQSGGQFKFIGLARNPEGVKSMAGFRRFWVEEAQTISEKSLKILAPTVRIEDSEIWMTANPQSKNDPFSKRFINPFKKELDKHGYYEDDLHIIVKCNYNDNPFFPEVLEQERLNDKDILTPAEYEHIWEGAFNDTVEDAIIKTQWFDAAVDAHKKDKLKAVFKPHGAIIAAHDPSDTGNDAKGFAVRHGSIIKQVREKLSGEIDEGCDWATSLAIKAGADLFVWDGDGMGAGLKRQVADAFNGKKIDYKMFRGSLSGIGQDNGESVYLKDESDNNVTYAETFKNNRAQYYIQLAERFYNTYKCVVKGEYIDPDDMISIDADGVDNLESLRSEVCRVPRKHNANGLDQIMTKKEMKQLGIDSPNMADCLMMSMVKPKVKKKRGKLSYQKVSIA